MKYWHRFAKIFLLSLCCCFVNSSELRALNSWLSSDELTIKWNNENKKIFESLNLLGPLNVKNSENATKVTVFWKGYGGQIFKAFPAKNKAPDWSTSSVSQSEACFFGGKELNYLPSMLFSKNGDFSSYYTTQLALKEIWCSIIECFWSRSSDDSEVFLSNQF